MPPRKYQDRALWVYTGNEGRLKIIRAEAEKRGLQPSKYLMAAEEAYRTASNPRPGSGKDLQTLRDANRSLAADLHEAKEQISQMDNELRKLRHSATLAPEGRGKIDPDLLQLLRAGPIHDFKILVALDLTPGSDAARGVAEQLRFLEKTGIISKTPAGWKWAI
jgi:hypothetical protein